MSMRNVMLAGLTCGLCLFAGYRLRVLADGAPERPSLFYSGMLERDGERANGEFTIDLALHSAASGGEELCRTSSKTTVDAGSFRIDATACESAIRDNANTWAEVSFAGTDGVVHAIEGRSKVGAVPYALEADRAISAQSAQGALEERLQMLTERLDALEAGSGNDSAFQAVRDAALSIPQDARTFVTFDDEIFDAGNEYDPATGVFAPKQAGVYAFACTLRWDPPAGVVTHWEASLHWNMQRIFASSGASEGGGATRTVYGVMQLKAGEKVQCAAYQESAAAQPLDVEWAVTVFDGHRIAR